MRERMPPPAGMTLAAPASGGALGALIGGCTIGLTISWSIANTGPVATLLSRRYGTSLAVIGLLTTVLFLAELVVMIPGGRAIDRYGAKSIGLAAVVVSLVGNLLLLTSTSPALALVLRAFTGLGIGVGFLAGAIYVQSGFARGAALSGGIYGGVAVGGGGLAVAVVPQLVGAFGWRAPYATAAIVLAAAIPVVALAPSTPGHRGVANTPSLRTLLADSTIARLGAMSSVSFGFSVILGNWVVTLLERNQGMSRGSAGAIGSLILILAVAGRPLGGILARAHPHVAWRAVAISFVAVGVGTGLLALSLDRPFDIVGAVVTGLAAGMPFGATLVGTTRTYPEAAGAAVGAMNIYPILVIVCGTPLVGLTFSLPGNGRIGFAVVAALATVAIVAIPYRLRLDRPNALNH